MSFSKDAFVVDVAEFRPGCSEADLFKSGEARGFKHITELFVDYSLKAEILRLPGLGGVGGGE